MGGKIEAYIDLASLYSYITFVILQDARDTLRLHSVEVEYHPVFLGAINNGSGNKPPWTLPAKAAYGWRYDGTRSLERVGLSHLQPPADMMAAGMTVLPMRALSFIKTRYSRETFETAFCYLFHCFWAPPNLNLSDPANLTKALCDVRAGFQGIHNRGDSSAPLFNLHEVDAIMQATQTKEMKDLLRTTTQQALDRGAFGAPWIWVTNSAGESEPFFGSDRFHFIYKFLGLPYRDVTLLPPSLDAGEGKSKL
ncbi:thioredoxin-like protein [Coniochaeta sp. PMI_546]|nr:thioredoxin-like protein [Coniochaeta sp. PMI_546]